MSKIRFLIYRSESNNLQTRQKNLKQNQLNGIALSKNDNTETPQT